MEEEYWVCSDKEEDGWYGYFATREDALEEALAAFPDKTVYTGLAVRPKCPDFELVHRIYEDFYEWAFDSGAFHAESWTRRLADVDSEVLCGLNGVLNSIIKTWLEGYVGKPNWFVVEQVEKHG